MHFSLWWILLFQLAICPLLTFFSPPCGNLRNQHLSRSLPKWAPLIDYWIIGIGERCPPTGLNPPPSSAVSGHNYPQLVADGEKEMVRVHRTCTCRLLATDACARTVPDSNNTDDSSAIIDKHLKHIPGELMVVDFDGMGPTWTKIVERGLGELSHSILRPVSACIVALPEAEGRREGTFDTPLSRDETEMKGIQITPPSSPFSSFPSPPPRMHTNAGPQLPSRTPRMVSFRMPTLRRAPRSLTRCSWM